MNNQNWKDRITFFCLGIITVSVVVLMIGASDAPPPNYGRYQISSFASSMDRDAGIMGAFVVDTATGETKTVYSRAFKRIDKNEIYINNLKKSFISME